MILLQANTELYINVFNHTYSANPEYLNVSIEVNKSKMNVSIESFTTITRAEIRMDVRMTVAGQNKYRNVLRKPINLCEFLERPRMDPVLHALYEQAIQMGMKRKKCPIHPASTSIYR